MVDFCAEGDFGRLEGIILCKRDIQEKNASRIPAQIVTEELFWQLLCPQS